MKLKTHTWNITEKTDFRKHRNSTELDHEKRIERECIPARKEGGATHAVGIFWATGKLNKRQITRLTELVSFFHTDRINNVLIPIISMRSVVSLRALDWFIINYAKRHRITLINKYSHFLSVYDDYRVWLKYWRRSIFDAFRRGTRIYFEIEGVAYATTVAQLNFLYWSEKTGVLDYVAANISIIEADVNQRLAECRQKKQVLAQSGQKRQRIELSRSPDTPCMIYKLPVTIQF